MQGEASRGIKLPQNKTGAGPLSDSPIMSQEENKYILETTSKRQNKTKSHTTWLLLLLMLHLLIRYEESSRGHKIDGITPDHTRNTVGEK